MTRLQTLEKKGRRFQWTLDMLFSRDVAQYFTLRDVESMIQLDAAKEGQLAPAHDRKN